MTFGVVGLGRVLTEPVPVDQAVLGYTTDAERVLRWGYRTFYRAEPGTGLTDLAVAAAESALADAGIDAEEVDLLILAFSDVSEYLCWDAAAATQARLGAHRAEALTLNQAGGGGVVGWDAVGGKFGTHPDYRTALIIGANRVCEAYWNRMGSSSGVCSDGAAAVVVARGHRSCRWLATEVITDGRYADFCRMEIGGASHPFTSGLPEPARVENMLDRLKRFFGADHAALEEFHTLARVRSREVIERACARAGIRFEAVNRLIHTNDNLLALTELAAHLGMPMEQTNAAVAMDHGHFGCADQLFGLGWHLDAGDLRAGDVVALTALACGMHWSCTLVSI